MKFILIATLSTIMLSVSAHNCSEEDNGADFNDRSSMYYMLKKAYKKSGAKRPAYDEFYRVGDIDAKNCIEVEKNSPNEDNFIGVYLFVKHFSARGPLFPARTVKKIVVHQSLNTSNIFEKVEMSQREKDLVSNVKLNDQNIWKTRFRSRDGLLFFKRTGKRYNNEFESYGYCYGLEDEQSIDTSKLF